MSAKGNMFCFTCDTLHAALYVNRDKKVELGLPIVVSKSSVVNGDYTKSESVLIKTKMCFAIIHIAISGS